MMKQNKYLLLLLIASPFILICCGVPQEDFDKVKSENMELEQQLEECQFGAETLLCQATTSYENKEFKKCITEVKVLLEKHPDSSESETGQLLVEKANIKLEKLAEAERIEKEKEREKERILDKLKAKYLHVRGEYVRFAIGDVIHYIFKDEKGLEYNFMMMRDETYTLDVGDEINPRYKGKSFDIFYKTEEHDILGWGDLMEIDVVYKMILVK